MNILKKIYHSKYFPRIFYVKPDGGKDSGVTGYFLIEWKWLFSIAILKFEEEVGRLIIAMLSMLILGGYVVRLMRLGSIQVRQFIGEYERAWKPSTPQETMSTRL